MIGLKVFDNCVPDWIGWMEYGDFVVYCILMIHFQ